MLNRRHFNHGYEFIRRFFRGFNLEQAIKLGTLLSLLYGISFGLNQLSILQEGQITDRYIKSIELLESEQMEVRHGAIYALARIAKDSPNKDADYVKKVLENYFRTRIVKWNVDRVKDIKIPSIYHYVSSLKSMSLSRPAKAQLEELKQAVDFANSQANLDRYPIRQALPADIQAALNVINSFHQNAGVKYSKFVYPDFFKRLHTLPNFSMLDFYYTLMGDIDLSGYNLSLGNFHGASIVQGDFSNAGLLKSIFKDATVLETSFSGSLLDLTTFENANLSGSTFKAASLKDASFKNAFLVKTDFKDANLCNADLRGAQFAVLVNEEDGTSTFEDEAQGLTVKQIDCSIWDESTVWPYYILEALAEK